MANVNGKRPYSSEATSVLDSLTMRTAPQSSHKSHKRRRQPTEFPSTSSFADLTENYNFVVDAEDILEDYLTPQRRKAIRPLVLDTEDGDWSEIPEYDHEGIPLQPGVCAMLKNGTFLRIQALLLEFDHGYVVLRGQKLARISRLRPILNHSQSKGSHELFMDLQVRKKSQPCTNIEGQIDVPVGWVEKLVTIHFCNGYDSHQQSSRDYFCQWKLTRFYEDVRSERKAVEVAIERLRASEADLDHQVDDETLKLDWRGLTERGGASNGSYTALDGFCCGGGWSRGASMAGNIEIIRSFDRDPKACSTYRVNFRNTKCLNVDVFEYCLPSRLTAELQGFATDPEHVDIAHYSTPCQFFSPAHTKEGQNDEMNFAASFCLQNLLEKDRPRVVTFENTAGLERRHFSSLKAIFGQITSLNYSLRFTCLNLADYGLPQNRKRLIMLASCPGEPLPDFPVATHSEGGQVIGTRPWVSQMEAISVIPFDGWQNHNPKQMKKKIAPSTIRTLAPTMTCGGDSDVHPDGREFTICELQLRQGFPLHHRFARELRRPQIRGQLGNAFPPLFVKKLLRHVRKQLQRTDGVPESIDVDEFMSDQEIREWEVKQFFKDHEQLPEGTRANVVFADVEAESEEDDEDDLEVLKMLRGEDNTGSHEAEWSWITTSSSARRDSSNSVNSSVPSLPSSQGSSTTFVSTSHQTTPNSIDNMYDALDASPSVLRSKLSSAGQPFQFSRRSLDYDNLSSPRIPLNRRYDLLDRDSRLSSMIRQRRPSRYQGSSSDDPIEL